MPNNISSKSLLHFTENFETLKKIVKSKSFRQSYPLEPEDPYGTIGIRSKKQYIPLVSFCDIPITLVDSHVEIYGYYCIGVSRDLGMARRNFNPLIYRNGNTDLADLRSPVVHKFLKRQRQLIKKEKRLPNLGEERYKNNRHMESFLPIINYIKPYKGGLKRKKSSGEEVKRNDYVFYNEKEWRYVPSLGMEGLINDDSINSNPSRKRSIYKESLISIKISIGCILN